MMMVVRVCVCDAAWLGAKGDAPRWGVRKILDALEEGLRKVLEAANPAPQCSSMVVRVAPFPFFNFKLLSTCGGTPTRWPKN